MNTTKINKIVKFAAAGLFLIALAINVKVTLDDPFVLLSEQAIATGSSTGSSTITIPSCISSCDDVEDETCTYYIEASNGDQMAIVCLDYDEPPKPPTGGTI